MRKTKVLPSYLLPTLKTALLTFALLAVSAAQAQGRTAQGMEAKNGQVLERQAVTLSAEEQAALLERVPGAAVLLAEVELQRITYTSDGLKVKGYLALPQGMKAGEKLPCIIFNRGGNRDFGALSDQSALYLLGRMARWGYVVVGSQYRGVAGGEGVEEFGGAEVADVLNLIPLLEQEPHADASRIGMVGWSRGGLMAYLALAETDRIKAAVAGAAMSDSFDAVARRSEMEIGVYAELVPGWPETREEALTARSPVRWPEKLHKETPILLLHGTADWRVHPTQSIAMASALLEAKHPFRLVLLEGGDHGLTEHRPEVERLMRHWMDHYVRDGNPWPSLEPHGR